MSRAFSTVPDSQEMTASYFCYTVIPLTSTHFPYGKLRQRVMLRGRELWTSRNILNVTASPRSWCRPLPNPCFSHFIQEEDIICRRNRNAGIFVSWHACFQSYDPNTVPELKQKWAQLEIVRHNTNAFTPCTIVKSRMPAIESGEKVFGLPRWTPSQIHIYGFVSYLILFS